MQNRGVERIDGESKVLGVIKGFPVPPSINAARELSVGWAKGKKNKRVLSRPSEALEKFHLDVECYRLQNLQYLSLLRKALRSRCWAPTSMVLVETAFYFPHSAILTKDGRLKKMDVENRFKYLMDAVSKLVEFDDSRFQIGCGLKHAYQGQEAYVNVRLTETRLRIFG